MKKGEGKGSARARRWALAIGKRLVVWPLVLLLGVLIVRWMSWAESRVFYVPSREAFPTPWGVEDVTFSGPQGRLLHGWFIPPAGSAREHEPWPVVLHCHGNAGNVSGHIDFSSFLAEHGLAVFIFDYRGYGKSAPASGLTRGQLMEDSRAAMDYLVTRRDIDPARVGVLGVSLGGVFATALAAERPGIRALCTVAAFSKWRGVAGDHVPILGPLLLSGDLNPADSLGKLKGTPVLIVHGELDEIVNVRHARILADAAKSSGVEVTSLIVPNAHHNDVLFTNQGEQDVVAEFFTAALGKK